MVNLLIQAIFIYEYLFFAIFHFYLHFLKNIVNNGYLNQMLQIYTYLIHFLESEV